jgi:hypothetical protein
MADLIYWIAAVLALVFSAMPVTFVTSANIADLRSI